MAAISKEDRVKRDARELSNWEPRRQQGETRIRENRQVEAVKAKEDGVQPESQGKRTGVVMRA